jgi:hypothetical protein
MLRLQTIQDLDRALDLRASFQNNDHATVVRGSFIDTLETARTVCAQLIVHDYKQTRPLSGGLQGAVFTNTDGHQIEVAIQYSNEIHLVDLGFKV